MNIKHKKTGGFTIVETLVAITVLMIAIAGPLVIASKGLTAALYAKDQMTASLLAQESMEVIKNVRSNIYESKAVWDQPLSLCTKVSPCDASAMKVYPHLFSLGCPIDGCPLDFLGGYTPDLNNAAQSTIFRRYFYLTLVSANEYTVDVVVTWKEGLIPNALKLSSELTNSER